MRGSRQPAVRLQTSDAQNALRTQSRHRRTKVARAAHTTLLKVDQWGRGDLGTGDIASAIERAVQAASAPKTKKKA